MVRTSFSGRWRACPENSPRYSALSSTRRPAASGVHQRCRSASFRRALQSVPAAAVPTCSCPSGRPDHQRGAATTHSDGANSGQSPRTHPYPFRLTALERTFAGCGRPTPRNGEGPWRAVRRANARSRATPPSPCFAPASDEGYLPTLTFCDATACHRPSRITQTSVQTYLPLLSLPLYVLFSVSLPVTTAVFPNTLTFMGPIS